jgi:Flp pilus assembly protein TadD
MPSVTEKAAPPAEALAEKGIAPKATPSVRAPSPASPSAASSRVVVPQTPAAATEGQTGASLTQQAQRMLERGSTSRATELARRATVADPSNAEAWLTLGASYDAAGNRSQARLAYKSCADSGKGPRVGECKALLGE